MGYVGTIEAPSGGMTLTEFTDAGSIAAYAEEALRTLVQEKLIAGSDGKLNPGKNATRAEATQFLANILD